MAKNTATQLLDVAERLFASQGFDGVSIASIADELGLTKQALLHHFGSKEALFGAVLQRISDQFQLLLVPPQAEQVNAAQQLEMRLLELYRAIRLKPAQSQLLMRELLDNNRRAASAKRWYLKPLLLQLMACVRDAPAWAKADDAQALALVYQLLGAINYFAISKPTLEGIFGDEAYAALDIVFEQQLRGLISAALASSPAPSASSDGLSINPQM
ncbi:MAG: TetR/AcrR family transcriptional regulator [Sphingomonadales bacterium]|mgnify:CR=1 FL=1